MASYRSLTFSALMLAVVLPISACAGKASNVIAPGSATRSDKHYSLLDFDYARVTSESQQAVEKLMFKLAEKPLSPNDKVALIIQSFSGAPYGVSHAQGEGDWGSSTKRGVLHVQQAPVYRTDQFVCNTLVQTVLALLQSHDTQSFNENILKIEYGAAGNSEVAYYNRNNFISGDFNPINQKNGLLEDVTTKFSHRTTSAVIDRANWFKFQQRPAQIGNSVSIIDSGNEMLNEQHGELMYQRFVNDYPDSFHQFKPEEVSLGYIPKENLVVYHNGSASDIKNEALIQTLPTPSVVEVVRDVKKWNIAGKNIKEWIGSELNVSHLGVIYRQNFKQNDVIYQKITCSLDDLKHKVCEVTPVKCTKASGCNEVMLADATDAYPNGYSFFKDQNGNDQCTAEKPAAGTPYTSCNRVVSLPLGDYFSYYAYGGYPYMSSSSIIGLNIQKILK